MNSGIVVTLAAMYFGANTIAIKNKNTNAYQSKLMATMPVVYPMLANASSIEGPTFVPHILNPTLAHPKDLLARKNPSPSFFLLEKLALYPMIINITRY